jgi:molybdopterin-synthase adenylyltransferase
LPRVSSFNYKEAFSRNLGWLTEKEQQVLRGKKVAIAGLGGVGGVHLLSLTRLGIGAFNIADLDRFDLVNFNRQVGATMQTLGQSKVEVLAKMAWDINPELDIRTFEDGVTADNIDAFLDTADVYVDGLDFFAFDARERTFAACAAKGIPAVTVAPIGMGAALLNFLPGRMSFEEYFRLDGVSETEKGLRLLLGLTPSMLHRRYLVDPSRVNLREQHGPSTIIGSQLCAGVAAAEVVKILLRLGRVLAAPWGLHFDAYTNRLARTWRPWGNANPLQQLMLVIAKRQFRA